MRGRDDHQPWDPSTPRVRVLLECTAASSPTMVAQVMERRGFAVRTCDGPGDRGGCDLIDSGACSLVSGADVVVNMLSFGEPGAHEVLDAVMAERRPPPVVVELTRQRREEWGLADDGSNPRGVTVLTTPVTSTDLVDGITSAIERQERGVPWWGDGCP